MKAQGIGFSLLSLTLQGLTFKVLPQIIEQSSIAAIGLFEAMTYLSLRQIPTDPIPLTWLVSGTDLSGILDKLILLEQTSYAQLYFSNYKEAFIS